ncbi:auxin-responsive protein SAUR64-like [Prunus yedoensis var. nudiflora]|uniref:Auxin-responsive protein SAUR64-like n=1 Tax=Prunus yedoensis var. nudiflora TaxID=2094558 RepID=A0A314U8C7_PRUYE|nr:auxin-responsive protein SAUR64-like [Prunus yedoensis var. nudiflora]
MGRNNWMNDMVGEKGTFVICYYTIDKSRFVLPLSYVSNYIFQELFKMSEEGFGVSSSRGPIILPCDSLFMNYILSLLRRRMTADLEKALLAISFSSCSSSALHNHGQTSNLTLPLWIKAYFDLQFMYMMYKYIMDAIDKYIMCSNQNLQFALE